MKTNFTLFILFLTFSVFHVSAQECSDLIISEVIEGWSNNKAVEIYNPTTAAIDASDYGLVRFQNGSTEPGNITYLTGVTIEPYDVYVVVIDKRNPDGVELEAPVWDELQAKADAFVNPDYNGGQEALYFNGNDAVALLTGTDGETLVDVFGKIADGINPDGWGPYTDSAGESVYISADHTLVRKASITSGYISNPSTFEILNEYDSLPANTFDQLGFHDCECNVNAIIESNDFQLKIFPNPIQDGFVTVASKNKMVSYTIHGMYGNLVTTEELNTVQNTYLDLSALPKGTYYFRARLENGLEIAEILIK